MENPIPEIITAEFDILPEKIFKDVLERTIEYEFSDYLHQHRNEMQFTSQKFNYKTFLNSFCEIMLSNMWYLLSKEPADNRIPVLIFQKEGVVVLIDGARMGDLSGLGIIITAENKADLIIGYKEIMPLLPTT